MFRNLTALGLGLMLLSACSPEPADVITAAGVVDGDVITVKAVAAGKIKILNITEGAGVKQGDMLAATDTDKIENQMQGLDIKDKEIAVRRRQLNRRIELLSANFSYWTDQVERFERLEKKESISGDQLEKARLSLDEVEASLFDSRQSLSALSLQLENIRNQREHLELLRADHVISSPVTGTVLEKFVSENEYVFPGTPLADILDRSSLFVEAFLEEQEISRLELGQEVEILVDGLEGRVFSGPIEFFGQKAEFSPKYIISEKERRSLLYRVRVRLERELEVFKLGMPVTVRLETAGAGRLP